MKTHVKAGTEMQTENKLVDMARLWGSGGASHPQSGLGMEGPISRGLKQQGSGQGCPWVSSRAEEKAQHPPGPSLSSGPKWWCPALDTLGKHLLTQIPRFAQDSTQPWEQSLSLNI